ncbi:MAG: glycosyltransferase family 4 protein [Sulfuricella sp.]|nr:glycosyltransferase family 4 protein [Sulfuricella sp.]
MRVCRVATVPFIFLHHLNSQIEATVAAGHEVYLVSSSSSGFRDDIQNSLQLSGVHFHAIEIPRKMSPLADLRALVALYRFFRQGRFDVVHSVTSKAGLLCAIAAMAARVPTRLHTFIGQPWAGLSGAIKWIFKACDWLIARLNTQCYADSESQRAFLVAEGIADNVHIKILGAGSIAGVNLSRFEAGRFEKKLIKAELSIPIGAQVIVFIGRITREKGIVELVAAFNLLSQKGFNNVFLLLVGPFESDSHLPEATENDLERNPHIRVAGYTDTPEKYLAAADLFCLPSYREGFGSVVVEAAAMGVPTVATRVVGLVDAVVENETGLLVPPKDANALAEALARLLGNPQLRRELGMAAQARARALFDSAVVNRLVLNEYANFS